MRPKFCEKQYNQVCLNQFCQLPVTTSGKKKEENWLERFLLKVYFIVSYFSLIIFSNVELTIKAFYILPYPETVQQGLSPRYGTVSGDPGSSGTVPYLETLPNGKD